MSQVKIFLTGATGYIGGEVLVSLLALPEASSRYHVSTLVRGQDRAAKLKEMGTRPVIASLDDVDVLKKEAEDADVVIHTAHADHMSSAQAIIAGLTERKRKTGTNGILIHTSGTGVLTDLSVGDYVSPTIYSDLDVQLIDALADTQPHRDVDLVVREAGASGDVDVYLVMPPTIYGIGSSPFHPISIQIPTLIRAAWRTGKVYHMGKGLSLWSDVHVADLASLYIHLLQHSLTHPLPNTRHVFDQYYFAESGEHSWGEAAVAIGKALVARGAIKDGTVGTLKDEDVVEYVGNQRNRELLGSNSRSRADRARQLGWTPTHTPQDFFRCIADEVDWILKNEKAMTQVKIFLTGATGYIGGEVLVSLLALPEAASRYHISTLVRGEERSTKLKELGTRPVIGSLDDIEILKREAEDSDVVIHTAHADHLVAAKAIIEGLVERKKKTGRNGILIHTSGTGVLADSAIGDFESPTVYSDLDIRLIDSLADSQPHRDVDLIIREAGASGNVDAYIVLPPTIYGIGPFNTISIQIPTLIRAALRLGRVHYVGKGLARWSNVHITDLATLYILIFQHALTHPLPATRHLFDQYYFAETGEHSWGEAATEIAKVLFSKGAIRDSTTSTLADADVVKSFKLERRKKAFGSNSRSRAHRGRQIGWRPTRTPLDFFRSIAEEVDWIMKNEKVEA
ncbi:hypothetical protein HDU93_009980 [Gonapodya sp. JEL0774]|nr:hypothetical protein HDU93_009980 [Gonapodya sp. JEL0774]